MPEYYTYRYKFYEPKAGEFKDHGEFRDGRLIHGSLSVSEKNGVKTRISYQGLPWAGWQAVVDIHQNDTFRSWASTSAVATELPQETGCMQLSTIQECKEESDANAKEEDCYITVATEASCGVRSEEASSMATVCSEVLTADASCKQTSTETQSTKAAAEALSEQTSTLPMSSSVDLCTNPPSKQSMAPETLKPSKGAHTKCKHKMCPRLHPSRTPVLKKSHKDLDRVLQTWRIVETPVRNLDKYSWLFSAQRNPLDLVPLQIQPSEHRKPLFTTPRGMIQRLNQHFSYSSHPPPQHQLSDKTPKPMMLSTRRKSYSVHQAGKTKSKRLRLRPEESQRRPHIVA